MILSGWPYPPTGKIEQGPPIDNEENERAAHYKKLIWDHLLHIAPDGKPTVLTCKSKFSCQNNGRFVIDRK